jgi:hypothetical protein
MHNQIIHNKKSYIKSTTLERTCYGSTPRRIHKKKLGDYLLKTKAQKKNIERKTMDQLSQCSIVRILFTQISQTHENRSNPEVTIKMFIFLDSISQSQIPPKLIKTQRLPKNLPTKNTQHHGIFNSQQPTLENTRNTEHPRHPYEIEDITYILHPFHRSPLIFYYAYIINKVSK